ncbi:MAG: hypothetical protein EAX86_09490 [Candidatus Heimdallarchaeota archaeon]|nr:hypothetical protein [Candidatus Heimdallarchaeota archaeon]
MWIYDLDEYSQNFIQNYESSLDRTLNEYNISLKSQDLVKKRLFSFLEAQIQLIKRRDESNLTNELNTLITEL